jgi:hypothetical protein
MSAWVHTHLPRLQAGDPDPISVKIPGQRIAYASWVSLSDVEFKVHEAGRRRCVREGVRNVHAWLVGQEILRLPSRDFIPVLDFPPVGFRQALYDPFRGPTFVDAKTLAPVLRADLAIMSGKNVYYSVGEVVA